MSSNSDDSSPRDCPGQGAGSADALVTLLRTVWDLNSLLPLRDRATPVGATIGGCRWTACGLDLDHGVDRVVGSRTHTLQVTEVYRNSASFSAEATSHSPGARWRTGLAVVLSVVDGRICEVSAARDSPLRPGPAYLPLHHVDKEVIAHDHHHLVWPRGLHHRRRRHHPAGRPVPDWEPDGCHCRWYVAPTAILVTHGHSDHLGDAVDISKRTGAPIVATYELGLFLGNKGVNVTPGNIGGTVTAGEATVKFVPAVHSSTVDENGSFIAASVPTGFVVRLNGKTIYVAGDTALFGDMELIGDEGLDVAIIPIGGQYTMDSADAVKAVAKLRPKTVIPGHFNTFPTIASDPAAFAEAVATSTKTRTVVLEPGQSAEV